MQPATCREELAPAGGRTITELIAVTGANGRLGQALLAAAPRETVAWSRPELDLDVPGAMERLLHRDRPRLVIHSAAMTAVDEAALHPERALRRNGTAVSELATACRRSGTALVLISTNEVFDGDRVDGRGYVESDPLRPRNAYGTSKLAGERAADAAFAGREGLWIVRTAWLFGPPGGDFPDKITAAADGRPQEPVRVVDDEVGSPTYTLDLARAIYQLIEQTSGGVFHLANRGRTSRFDWARAVLHARRPGRAMQRISRTQFRRASDPPPWGVLDCSRAAAAGVAMRPWTEALSEYLSARSEGVADD